MFLTFISIILNKYITDYHIGQENGKDWLCVRACVCVCVLGCQVILLVVSRGGGGGIILTFC